MGSWGSCTKKEVDQEGKQLVLVSYVCHSRVAQWCVFPVASEFVRARCREAEREGTGEEGPYWVNPS